MWRFITQLEDLLKYFLDLKQGRLLKRDFTFKILSNLRNQEFKELIQKLRQHRSILNEDMEKDVV